MTSVHSDLHDPSNPAYKKARRQYLKTTRNRKDEVEADWTPFRAAEKKYKAKFPPPDLSDVLDLALLDESRSEEYKQGGWTGSADTVEYQAIDLETGRKAYIFPRIPGALARYSLRSIVCTRLYISIADYQDWWFCRHLYRQMSKELSCNCHCEIMLAIPTRPI